MLVDPWQILLIEDNNVLARSISESIMRRDVGEGGQKAIVDIAEGFTSGLEKLVTTKYDLVVLDIRDESAEAHQPASAAGDETTPADVGIRLYHEIRSRRTTRPSRT